MPKYIPFTDEQKQRANSVDLVDFLRSQGEEVTRAGGELRRQVRYGCHYKVRHPQSCDGQSGYGTTKLDALVEQAIKSLFERIKDTPKEKLLSTEYENQLQIGKTALEQATERYKTKTKELDLYKSEVKKVIAGTSSFDMELLNELIAEAKEQITAAEADMENAQANIDGYEQLSEKVTERYNKVVTLGYISAVMMTVASCFIRSGSSQWRWGALLKAAAATESRWDRFTGSSRIIADKEIARARIKKIRALFLFIGYYILKEYAI